MAKRANNNNPQPARTRIEMIGSEAATNKSGPLDMRQSAFPGGVAQMIGSQAGLVHRTTPMGEFDKHVRGGMEEMIGSEATLDRTPRRAWQSYDAPMSMSSDNPQSEKSGYPGSGPRQLMKE